jgi:hypothetical protein
LLVKRLHRCEACGRSGSGTRCGIHREPLSRAGSGEEVPKRVGHLFACLPRCEMAGAR